ncbi:MAG: peptide deformylase [Chlorobi bacterium]|nr:peptide deformylase [Chlorobiota bacterium]
MILPIIAYGHPILRKKGVDIDPASPEWQTFIDRMFETMYHAKGVGLAAPQVDKAVRIFVIDPSPFADRDDLSEEEKARLREGKRVFINARKVKEEGPEIAFEEGCLSIPGIYEKVKRPATITLEYLDREGNKHVETFDGLMARVIQHEYDHIEGILFTDRLTPLKRRLLRKKLDKISRGEVRTEYKMKFPRKVR